MKKNSLKTKALQSLSALFFSCILLISGCNAVKIKKNQNAIEHLTPNQEHSVKAVLWQQTSGEYKALAYQAYKLAKIQLDERCKEKKENGKPLAIVTDIDETVLDNSPYFAKNILLDDGFDRQRWIDWGKKKSAKSIPGAIDFFNYAFNKDVEIFYISNRYDIQLAETVENLKNAGFPFADEDHIILKSENMIGKESRRNDIRETHNIIMLIGDNLSDFSNVFEKKSIKERNDSVDKLKERFGERFIVLPNPMYGDWENHDVYQGKYNWASIQKDSIRRSKLISY